MVMIISSVFNYCRIVPSHVCTVGRIRHRLKSQFVGLLQLQQSAKISDLGNLSDDLLQEDNWSLLHPVKTMHNQAAKKWSDNLWKCCFTVLQLISSSSNFLFL